MDTPSGGSADAHPAAGSNLGGTISFHVAVLHDSAVGDSSDGERLSLGLGRGVRGVASSSSPGEEEEEDREEEEEGPLKSPGLGIMSTSLHAADDDNCSHDSYHLSENEAGAHQTVATTAGCFRFPDRRSPSPPPPPPPPAVDNPLYFARAQTSLHEIVVQAAPSAISPPSSTSTLPQKPSSPPPAYRNDSTTTSVPTASTTTTTVTNTNNVAKSEEPSTVPFTYGATGPIAGKVLTKDAPVIKPADADRGGKVKPAVPPKPKFFSKPPTVTAPQESPRLAWQQSSSYGNVQSKTANLPPPPADFADEQTVTSPPPAAPPSIRTKPPDIQVQCDERPEIQHRYVLNGDIPYVLHMRHVQRAESAGGELPRSGSIGASTPAAAFSTFKDPKACSGITLDGESGAAGNSRGRQLAKSVSSTLDDSLAHPFRRKSLDLVRKKRLPSPGNFSSQDHSVSPTTPDTGNILDYLERRRRSFSQDRNKRLKKREDRRRKTQPVRFNLVEFGTTVVGDEKETAGRRSGASSSQPELPISADFDSPVEEEEDEDEMVESISLHEAMDRLEEITQTEKVPPKPPVRSSDPPFIDDTSSGSERDPALVKSSYTASGVLYTDF